MVCLQNYNCSFAKKNVAELLTKLIFVVKFRFRYKQKMYLELSPDITPDLIKANNTN